MTKNQDKKSKLEKFLNLFKKKDKDPNKKRLSLRLLDGVEKVGNKLPNPATLFALLAFFTLLLSSLIKALGVEATHPGTGATIQVNNLLSAEGLRFIFANLTSNYINFPPLGIVVVAMIGIGMAEGSGLISAALRHMVTATPKKLLTASVITAGILSHLASSVGYVVLIPLGAMVFAAFNRHPIAGLAAAFCGVSAGFGANFMIGSVDPILAGLSESAANIIAPNMELTPAINLYFMVASGVMLVVVGTWITEKFVEPRLGEYHGELEKFEDVQDHEKKGLFWAGISVLVMIILFLLMLIPENGILRNQETGSILNSPFMDGLITAIFLIFFVPGLVYGIAVGTIKNDKDALKHMTASMKNLAGYLVLVFFAAQFVYIFKESNLGVLLAIKGAELLEHIGMTGIGLFIAFVIISAFINLFMGSASAKWAIMAPIFVPMFMLLGYHPALTQAAYRIGDSVTNVITPMMSYFALIVTFAQKYKKNAGIGTIIATMLPYTVILSLAWIILLAVWMLLGLPIGVSAPINYMP
ncbi:MAG: AbgT family transporter [Candidatus Marinimicrobia bacterium]|nr:AbgT family transporter [Candidatus Neomarinimicrobiota bacterium]